MLEKYSYDEIVALCTEFYVKDFGEIKSKKVIEKVLTSTKTSKFILLTDFQKIPPTTKQILYCINGMAFFIFSSNRTQALGALWLLVKWNDEVNSIFGLINENSLKRIAIEIIGELEAHFVVNTSTSASFKGSSTKEEIKTIAQQKIGDNIFYLATLINLNEYKQRLGEIKYKESEIPSSKIITHYHNINWKNLENLKDAQMENPIKFVTYFNKETEVIQQQNIQFNSNFTALTFFHILTKNNAWEVEYISSHHCSAKSKDHRYKLELEKNNGYLEDNESTWLYLNYL